ncbi:acyl-CoA reductase [Pseudofrankia inefficax]|uniref:Acyl-CoA reductase n=1 Tax=Pseudofrankia inefficax (strain DSM 45817 / CECT 9037 / DDB 130130 / EuI1c) TaxID=298654 RepID=E3JC51_PSEI1|nr:acyl-CoA reductase [Pseudofrankia inefficax]ADP83507.1 Long-chain-fatty-acyl-CoA reductase [Pseudofrankia inefficax]
MTVTETTPSQGPRPPQGLVPSPGLAPSGSPTPAKLKVPHVVRGKVVWGEDVEYASRDFGVPFVTPRIHFNELITPRTEQGPAFDVPLTDIIDYLVEVAAHLDLAKNPYLQESLELTAQVSQMPRRMIENTFHRPGQFLTRQSMGFRLEKTFRDVRVLDGWVEHTDPTGRRTRIRAFPPRLVHMLAGNSPSGAMTSIADAALVKAINVFKLPSADPFTTVAVLRTMADIDPDHPVLRSMSAVYWKGGDAKVENVLYRAQYFDKIIGWGGGAAINNVIKYTGPGFHLVAFDPKVSMAIIGREALASPDTMREVAELAALDATVFNQDACLAARHIAVEADVDDDAEMERLDQFCALLRDRLNVDREFASAVGPATPSDIREAVEGMRFLEPDYRIWGEYDGSGLVVRSPEPVDFHPTNKTVNVVPVGSLVEATHFANVATQTVGVYPPERKAEIRDLLATAGVQRVVRLGSAMTGTMGNPHDGMYPLHRFVNWVADDDA